MAGKVAARRAALREDLIEIAQRTIGTDGLAQLRARDLAKEAGCALGAIYNMFDDLDDLILAVNALTFKRLGAAVAEELAAAPQDPTDQLVVMAQAYHHFAAANYNHWRALFDLDRPTGQTAPDWYLKEMTTLFAYIDAPLRVLFPAMSDADRDLMVRGLFSAVHGIVLLGLDEASAGLPAAQLDRMIDIILRRMTASQ